MTRKFCLLTAHLLCAAAVSLPAHAQSIGPSTLNAAGGSGIISGNTHEYAIATEVLGPTSSLLVTPGPLQPLQGPDGIKVATGLTGHLSIFPNPAQTLLHLQPAFPTGGALSYSLADAAGKVVLRQSAQLVTGTEQQTLNLGSVAVGTYLLTVQFGEAGAEPQTATYKVQKIQ
jgi:hypothetical protein